MQIRRRLCFVRNIFYVIVILVLMMFMMFLYNDYSAQIPFKLVLDVMIVQFVAFKILARRIRVRVLDKRDAFIHNDENVSFVFRLDKRSIYPFKAVEYHIKYKNRYEDKYKKKKLRVEMNEKRTQKDILEIGKLCCGYNEVIVESIVIYDMFGFASSDITKRLPVDEKIQNMIVLPAVADVAIDENGLCILSHEEAEEYFGESSREDSVENYEIREFIQGDKLNKIHWKLSTKSNELMVRDTRYEVESGAYVFFDLCADEDINEVFTEKNSMCAKLLEMGYAVYVVWLEYSTYAKRFVQRRRLVKKYDQLDRAVIELMGYPLYRREDKAGMMELRFMKEALGK